jgi:hypothetical protein
MEQISLDYCVAVCILVFAAVRLYRRDQAQIIERARPQLTGKAPYLIHRIAQALHGLFENVRALLHLVPLRIGGCLSTGASMFDLRQSSQRLRLPAYRQDIK